MKKTAVVLFNLGGPDKLENVKPFLFNLFNDKAIINLPTIFRYPLAKFISARRESKAQSIYAQIGGKSPLLENTIAQAKALESSLGNDYKVFVAMRYWHPMSEEVIKQVNQYAPDEIVLLPLYPQYSSTTTGSSIKQWQNLAPKSIPTRIINCYQSDSYFIKSIATKIAQVLENKDDYVVLFTAHGLPQSIVDQGDPYQKQVEESVASVVDLLKIDNYSICYQSRVGPKAWIKPYAEYEIVKYAKQNKRLIVVPISFVSEHSETLVELDIDYYNLAMEYGAKSYERISANGTCDLFIQCLARQVKK